PARCFVPVRQPKGLRLGGLVGSGKCETFLYLVGAMVSIHRCVPEPPNGEHAGYESKQVTRPCAYTLEPLEWLFVVDFGPMPEGIHRGERNVESHAQEHHSGPDGLLVRSYDVLAQAHGDNR